MTRPSQARRPAGAWSRRLWGVKNSNSQSTPETLDQPSPAVLLGAVLVDELIRNGVREAVVCPGSRSAPLALAFAEASRAGRLRLHVRTDERSASFLALGLAKYSDTPVPVVMTSGTAVANCLPAMVEATATNVPLLILSANRPWSMVGTGANQTIQQREIFGAHAVATLELDAAIDAVTAGAAAPSASADAAETDPAAALDSTNPLVRRVRVKVDELLRAATHPSRGGGAHLDIPLREPLVPESITQLSLLARQLAEQPARATAAEQPTAPARTYVLPKQAARLPYGEATVDASKRTLVIAGSVSDRAWAREQLEELGDLPVLAEPASPAPDFPVHPAAAAMFTTGLVSHGEYSAATRPEQVIVLGRPTLHRPVTQLLASEDISITVLTEVEQPTDVALTADRVASTVRVTGESPQSWLQVCRGVSELGAEAVRDGIAQATEDEVFTGLHVAGVLADSLRDGDALFVGASSPIRDIARVGLPFDGVRTVANRGAAGIDGLVSTAVGTALAHASADPTAIRAPRTFALLGDLSFLHDVNGLHFGPDEPGPENLVIVVANDDGGAIFETLEPGGGSLRSFDDGTPAFERVFGTGTGAKLAGLCESAGVDWVGVHSPAELAEVLDALEHGDLEGEVGENLGLVPGRQGDGVLVVEAFVDRGARVVLEKSIRGKVTPGE